MIRSEIVAVAGYVPPRVVTNQDLSQWMETSDEWIVQRTGIKERRWVNDGSSASDLALHACQTVLERANFPKEKIDCIFFATTCPDHEAPGTGCFLQAKLGLSEIPAFEVRQQCSGFIYALSVADMYIRAGTFSNILVVGSEVQSKGLDISTRGRDTAILFGDGAGAALLSAREVKNKESDSFIFSTHLHADGSNAKELWVPAPGFAFGTSPRLTQEMIREGQHFAQMNGKKVFMHAVKRMSEVLLEGLAKNQMSLNDVDLFFFHQANLRINETIADMLKIPPEKIFNTIQKYGNTTAATIPLGMRDAFEEGKLRKGMKVALVSFGSGFTWASAIVRF